VAPLGRWAKGVRAAVRDEAERIGAFLAAEDEERDVAVRFGQSEPGWAKHDRRRGGRR